MDKELSDIVFHGREERNIEYKSSVSWNDAKTKAKITKCILAMSNIRDGGYLIIGDEDKTFNPIGMTNEDFDSFNQDDLNSHIANFADPFVDITVYSQEHEGRKFIIIRINEFHEIPIICKKNGDENLKAASVYTRPRQKYESSVISSQTEMREIIDMAINKALRNFQEKATIAGFLEDSKTGALKNSKKEFDKQLGNL